MKLNSKTVAGLLATTAVAFSIAAQAAEPPAGCEMMGRGMMQDMKMTGDPAARAEQHLSHFKSELKITAGQEPLWQAFAEKVKANAGQGMKAMRETAKETVPAPERMAQMIAMMKERTAAMESVSESFKRLYDALTPEQKAVADKHGVFGHRMGQKGGRGGRGGQGPQGRVPPAERSR